MSQKHPSPPDSPSSFTDADLESAAEAREKNLQQMDDSLRDRVAQIKASGGTGDEVIDAIDDDLKHRAATRHERLGMRDNPKRREDDTGGPFSDVRVGEKFRVVKSDGSLRPGVYKKVDDDYATECGGTKGSTIPFSPHTLVLWDNPMRENPSRFKEGDRVTFNPTPAALQLYTAGTYPPIGTSGSVTTVSVPGGGRRTTMPGPRGGMLYVKWDGWNTVGVFPVDVVREYASGRPGDGGRKQDLCPSRDFGRCQFRSDGICGFCGTRKNPSGHELNAHEVVIDDPSLVKRLFDWHSGQGDPVYAVASSSLAGRPVTRALVDDAISNLQNFLRKTKGKDKKDLEAVIDELQPYGT